MKRILTASLIVILIVLSAIPLSAKEKVIDVIDQYITGLKKSRDSEHKLYYINLLSPYKDARTVPVI
ncbi:MAG: hypothetical protein KAS39_02505, partial [Actinomycetia bacterium]|nr:hypothetical protein [Actinomycetes bacterium]